MVSACVVAGVVASSTVGLVSGRWIARKRLERRFAEVLEAVARLDGGRA